MDMKKKLPPAGPYSIVLCTNNRHSWCGITCTNIGTDTNHVNIKQTTYNDIYNFRAWSNFMPFLLDGILTEYFFLSWSFFDCFLKHKQLFSRPGNNTRFLKVCARQKKFRIPTIIYKQQPLYNAHSKFYLTCYSIQYTWEMWEPCNCTSVGTTYIRHRLELLARAVSPSNKW